MNTITATSPLTNLFIQRSTLQESNTSAQPSTVPNPHTTTAPNTKESVPQGVSSTRSDEALPKLFQALQRTSQGTSSVESTSPASAITSSSSGVNQTNPYDSLSRIEDAFTPSKELSAALNAKAYVKNGLSSVDAFKSMANQLQIDGVLNRDDMMAVDFLSAKSPNITLKDFDAMIKNDNLSREMRSLIAQLVQKLHMVDYLSGGLMSS